MPPEVQYLSVSDLLGVLHAALEQLFPVVLFEGEIAEISRPASGHLYFTIKDKNSQVSAVMWRTQVGQLGFKPEPGVVVLCHGRPAIYNKNGRFQIVVQKMLPGGEGLLQKRFLELKAKLEKEGIFDPSRKRAIPVLSKAIGVVTSASGAVIHDIMTKVRERLPNQVVYLIDVRVQGDGAAQEIAAAVKRFSESGTVDVIIVARGGGSLEDLWAFNEEIVARAIFASHVPVVSGVGHEVDVTLSDLAADVRAPTPTAAAEMVVPKRVDVLQRLAELRRRLDDFDRWLRPSEQLLDELASRLGFRAQTLLQQSALRLKSIEHKVRGIHPERILAAQKGRLDLFLQRLQGAMKLKLNAQQGKLTALSGRLETINPLKVLERGYSVVQDDHGVVVRDTKMLEIGTHVRVRLHRGNFQATVSNRSEEK